MNQKLSLERAASVRDYLVSRGIKPERIQASGQGELHPVAPNETPEGRAQNRRVELIIQNARRNNNTAR
jgi:OmpA-OmpF porin, OOP family